MHAPARSLQRPVARATGPDLEHAGLDTGLVGYGPDAEALQQAAAGNVLDQLLDRDASLHAPDVRLGEQSMLKGMSREGEREIF